MTTVEKTERTTITDYSIKVKDTKIGSLRTTKKETDTQGDTTFQLTVGEHALRTYQSPQMEAIYRVLHEALRMPSYDPEVWEEDPECHHHVPCANPGGCSGKLRRKRN